MLQNYFLKSLFQLRISAIVNEREPVFLTNTGHYQILFIHKLGSSIVKLTFLFIVCLRGVLFSCQDLFFLKSKPCFVSHLRPNYIFKRLSPFQKIKIDLFRYQQIIIWNRKPTTRFKKRTPYFFCLLFLLWYLALIIIIIF